MLAAGGRLAAQEPGGTADVAHDVVAPTSQHEASENQIDIVHHLANSHELETPFGVVPLPRWEPIHIGGIALDLSPTKHLVYMLLAAIIVALVFLLSARTIAREQARGRLKRPNYWPAVWFGLFLVAGTVPAVATAQRRRRPRRRTAD